MSNSGQEGVQDAEVAERLVTSEPEVEPLPVLEGEINLDVLQNIPVTLSVEVGRTVLKIKDLLSLSEGSVVKLDRLAGEAIDVCVNNTVVARGEVVVVNERYGIRLTQVLDTAEKLGKA